MENQKLFAVPDPDAIRCPYCNTPLKEYAEPTFTTPCCNRVAKAYMETVPELHVTTIGKYTAEVMGVTGDVSKLQDMPRLLHSRPESKWTRVYWDRGFYFVRLIPNMLDLEEAGRPWGLALATRYNSPYEAHKFADSVDQFFDLLESTILRKDEEEKECESEEHY